MSRPALTISQARSSLPLVFRRRRHRSAHARIRRQPSLHVVVDAIPTVSQPLSPIAPPPHTFSGTPA